MTEVEGHLKGVQLLSVLGPYHECIVNISPHIMVCKPEVNRNSFLMDLFKVYWYIANDCFVD